MLQTVCEHIHNYFIKAVIGTSQFLSSYGYC